MQGGSPTYNYNTLNDLINEKPASVQLLFGGCKGLRTTNMGYYFQDDWRVSSNLQVNLGLRYEYSPPLRGGFNVAGSDPFGPFIAAQQPMFAADHNDFAPRAGVVWTPGVSQRTVILAGGGISYIMPQALFYYEMAYVNPALPFVASFSSADVPPPNLVYPAVIAFSNQLQANPSLLPADFRLSRSIADYNRRDTYAGMWNFAVQQQINSGLAVQAAYVGQRTVKLISVRPLNLVDPRTGGRPDPSLGQINFEENAANISYHALELSVNQRVWHGLSYDAYFTWARSIGYYTPDDTITFTGNGLQDPLNIAGSTGPIEVLPSKNFRGVFSYAIPGGTGLHNWFARGLLSGWTIRGIVGWRSGLNTAAFSVAAVQVQRRFGNLGFDAMNGPSAFTLDSGLHKTFSLTEPQKVTFRFEAFNTLNHTVFSSPVATVNNPNFGRITSAGSPRLYQLALKYVF